MTRGNQPCGCGTTRGRYSTVVILFLAMSLTACTQPSKPNILVITLDTTRADALGLYGRSPSPSPELDRFAEGAVVYDRAYTPSSWTLPSHASLFTGLLPHEHGAGSPYPAKGTMWNARPLGESYTTLAELLHTSGYRTRAVIGGPAMAPELGMAQGFEKYDAEFETPLHKIHGKRATYVADKAIEYIREPSEQPYFVFVNFFDPHRPYAPPPPYNVGLPASPTAGLDSPVIELLGAPVVAAANLEPGLRARLDGALACYDAEIRYMDAELGRLLAAADAVPAESRPIVIITADHGESFGEHYYMLHGAHIYEDNVRVPLIVRDPRSQQTTGRRAHPTETHRAFGFLLGRAGIPVPADVDAAGFDDPRAPIVTEVWRTSIAMMILGTRADRDLRALYEHPYKLIVSTTGEAELYDVDADPGELHDLNAAQPERVAAMRATLQGIVGEGQPLYDDTSIRGLDAATESALQALGYLEEESP